jgi:hypothetical protein
LQFGQADGSGGGGVGDGAIFYGRLQPENEIEPATTRINTKTKRKTRKPRETPPASFENCRTALRFGQLGACWFMDAPVFLHVGLSSKQRKTQAELLT